MTTKLSINIKEGTIEVEGEESFVAGVYADFKEQLVIAGITRTATTVPALVKEGGDKSTVDSKPVRKSRTTGKGESLAIIKDLDLSARGNSRDLSLRDFYAEKKPSNAMERSTVFVYFLQVIMGASQITLNHIYSCYKDVGAPVPSVRKSVANASGRKGYLNSASFDDIKLGIPGENLVEQYLPKQDN